MIRALPIILLVLFFLVTGGVLLWYFAYGLDRLPPRHAAIPGLTAEVEIGWHRQDFVSIQAQNEQDALAGLGYAHGYARTWSMVLWRQTALGRLGEWFGDGVLDLDRLSRRLGFAVLARQAYSQLPQEDQALLEAYTAGINAALGHRPVRLQDEFTLLNLTPAPWEPWHTLALERLFAWLFTDLSMPDAAAGDDAEAFSRADDLLRGWLHLHGFENGAAWAVQDTSGTYFFQRHVYGASALPLFQEIIVTWPDQGTLQGASLPGTPFFPAGKSRAGAWSLLPASTVQLVKTVHDTTARTVTYERILSDDGGEHLLRIQRSGPAIYFDPPPRPAPPPLPPAPPVGPDSIRARGMTPGDTLPAMRDSTWTLRWPGLSPATDWPAWRGLLTGTPASFHLIEGNGLRVHEDGTWQVLGTPEVTARFSRGILVGNTSWAQHLAVRLDSLTQQDTGVDVRAWATDYYSPWAAELAPLMVASVDSVLQRAEPVEEALTYLRNWNYSYDRTSIAASIFDTWVTQYRDSTGRLPRGVVPDTVYFENLGRYQALHHAVAGLYRQFGDDLRQWRWENVYPDRRLLPVWSADTLLPRRLSGPARTRYAPLELPSRGHPSALYWGTSPVQDARPSPAAWEGWITTRAWGLLYVRRPSFQLEAFLGRYRASERVPPPTELRVDLPPEHRTTLVPEGSLSVPRETEEELPATPPS